MMGKQQKDMHLTKLSLATYMYMYLYTVKKHLRCSVNINHEFFAMLLFDNMNHLNNELSLSIVEETLFL